MAEITKEQFKVVGKNTKTMESISRPNIGYWQDAWRRIRKNKIAFFSLCLFQCSANMTLQHRVWQR